VAKNKIKTCLTITTTTDAKMLHCISRSVQSLSEKTLSLSSQLSAVSLPFSLLMTQIQQGWLLQLSKYQRPTADRILQRNT